MAMRSAAVRKSHPLPQQALGEPTVRNTKHQVPNPSRNDCKWQPSSRLLHHESLRANENLQELTVLPPENSSIRESPQPLLLTCSNQHDMRRDSQISATSTNASSGTKPRKRHIGPWLLGVTLGKGANGRVRKARHALTAQEAAVKIVSRKSAAEHRSKSVIAMDKIRSTTRHPTRDAHVPFGIEREIVIMKLIEHPNIIKLYDVWENRGELFVFLAERRYSEICADVDRYLVLELVEGGELFHHIVEHSYLPEDEAVRIFRQIISGLAHCHRFRLCHRDLKPENILLDGNGNIKIVDFGMASMQPWGKWLDTSCGSPHYAPPEIAQGLRYEGDKADIWSAGVVLYVMLVGQTPFGASCDTSDDERGRDGLRQILEEVITGELIFPSDISDDAQNFIVSLLRPNPKDRLTIEEMWRHPFLSKYELYAKDRRFAQTWIGGPQPRLTAAECGPVLKNRTDIDMDIVGNLSTLWHTDDHESILASLLSKDPNYEQVFYHRLIKSREEQEENFQGTGVEISSSDYHHVAKRRVLKRSGTRATMIGAGQKRHRSQFSIVSEPTQRPNPHARRTASEASTDQSYDPFRASRQFINTGTGNSKITVLRGSSGNSRKSENMSNGKNPRHPAFTRLQNDTGSWMTSSSLPPLPQDATGKIRDLRRKALSQGYSRQSIGSSVVSKTSSRASRHTVSHKRLVSFQHLRRRSTKMYPLRPNAPSPLNMQERYLRDQTSSNPQLASSELQERFHTDTKQPVHSRKEGATRQSLDAAESREEKRFSAYLKDEARQVSQELGRFCDDAFNKGDDAMDSAGAKNRSIVCASIHRQPGQIATPPPRKSSANQGKQSFNPPQFERKEQRPLPELPITESMISRRLRELAKTRENMVASAKILPPGTLDEAIKSIDRLIAQTCEEVATANDRRIVSAPAAGPSDCYALPPVKGKDGLRMTGTERNVGNRMRHISEPIQSTGHGSHTRFQRLPWDSEHGNLRMANDLDALPAPLNIRKKASDASIDADRELFHGLSHVVDESPTVISRLRPGYNTFDTELEPIEEDDKENRDPLIGKQISRDSKLRGWFRKSAASQKNSESERGPTPPAKDGKSVQITSVVKNPYLKSQTALDNINGKYIDKDIIKTKTNSKGRFFALFGKRDLRHGKLADMILTDDVDAASLTPSSNPSYKAYITGAQTSSSTLSVLNGENMSNVVSFKRKITSQPRNWLARFLHVKPAKRVVALQVSKVKALKEVRGILRDWKRYGIRDIVTDKAAGRLWARVDEDNRLHMRPVSLAIEFFTVIQRGRKANLCLARFSQERGAKSSFEKVVQTMKGILRGRSLLVMERKKAKDMRKCLIQWEAQ